MPDTTEEKKIKRIYKELQGYLSQIPLPQKSHDIFYHRSEWNYVNDAIDRLNGISGENYDEFKIIEQVDRGGFGIDVSIALVRIKLGGLINSLHEAYFPNDHAPFSGNSNVSSMVINNQNSQQQTQEQRQEQKVELEQMLQNAQNIILEEYGEEEADNAINLIKKIITNPKNWGIIAASIVSLANIGHVAFVAALPILGKVLLTTTPVHTT